MPETLETFIIRRLSEIAAEEHDVQQTLNLLHAEQEKLRLAADAAGIMVPDDIATMLDNAENDPYPIHKRKISERTIKETVIEILKEAGGPMTALQMLPIINDRLNADYPRSSLSPQLSRLKAEGILDLDGRNWFLLQPKTTAASNPAHMQSEHINRRI